MEIKKILLEDDEYYHEVFEKETLFNFIAICHENRLEIVRKRLVKFRLV